MVELLMRQAQQQQAQQAAIISGSRRSGGKRTGEANEDRRGALIVPLMLGSVTRAPQRSYLLLSGRAGAARSPTAAKISNSAAAAPRPAAIARLLAVAVDRAASSGIGPILLVPVLEGLLGAPRHSLMKFTAVVAACCAT